MCCPTDLAASPFRKANHKTIILKLDYVDLLLLSMLPHAILPKASVVLPSMFFIRLSEDIQRVGYLFRLRFVILCFSAFVDNVCPCHFFASAVRNSQYQG